MLEGLLPIAFLFLVFRKESFHFHCCLNASHDQPRLFYLPLLDSWSPNIELPCILFLGLYSDIFQWSDLMQYMWTPLPRTLVHLFLCFLHICTAMPVRHFIANSFKLHSFFFLPSVFLISISQWIVSLNLVWYWTSCILSHPNPHLPYPDSMSCHICF